MKQLFFAASLLLVAVGFGSCGDDDDDNGGGASTSAGVLDKSSGLRIKSFGRYTVYYDDNGRIDYISVGSDERYEFKYNPNKIVYADKNQYYDEEGSGTVGYNSSGFLTSISFSNSYWSDDYSWTESSQLSLSYDSSGHLTKISGSGKEIRTEDGERRNETWSESWSLTWRNNLLQRVVGDWKEADDGETETVNETWVFSYDNDSYENVYRQWAPSVGQFANGILEFLAYTGLLGVGPTMLPSSCERTTEEYEDGKLHTYDDSYTYRYGFNGDGSISYTTVNGTRYNFSYDYAETGSTRSENSTEPLPEKEMAAKLGRMFRHSHKM